MPLLPVSKSRSVLAAAIIVFLLILGVVFYPSVYSQYIKQVSKTSLMFIDVTDAAGLKRHHSGANWLGTFSVSTVDYDNDGDVDILANNHERNRPYFYRNNGDRTFTEMHETLGLLENPIGPVFGEPKIDRDSSGFFVWLDPEVGINGTWHVRWKHQPQSTVSGELITNSHIEEAHGVGLSGSDQINVEGNTVHFESRADATAKGIDFKSSFPESTIQFALRIDGKADPVKVFIGPRGVHPTSMPFSLSLGDRHGTVWGDYNNDGKVDLFVTQGAMVGKLKPPHDAKHEELFKNTGAGLVNVVGESGIRNDYGRGRDAQWVDYDNDGLLDLYVSNIDAKNMVFHNKGNGSFQEIGARTGLDFVDRTHFVWADFNNDGLPDVFFTNPDGLFLSKGGGQFVDVSRENGLDVPRDYENIKDAFFWGSGASVADFDNDGDLDVFLASGKGGGQSRLLENRNGKFNNVAAKAGLGSLRNVVEAIWGDFDNDGHTDLYTIGTDPESNRLFRNNGNGTFTDVTDSRNLRLWNRFDWNLLSHAGGVAAWVDYDGDGFLDLFLATRRPKGTEKQDNVETDGQASTWMSALAARAHQLMKGKIQGTHFLLRNSGNGSHWIDIKLAGTKSNRDGFGAKVFVATRNTTQFQEAGANGKMLFAQNNAPLHFGLGKAATVDNIKVIWPSGREQNVQNVRANQVVRIEEPAN